MKKQLLTLFAAAAAFTAQAQVVNDSANSEAAYIKNVWYNLDNGTKTIDSASNWDFAVAATASQSNALITAIHFNPKIGRLYEIDSAASTFTNVFDTTGINNWALHYNSDSSWAHGAFNNTNVIGSYDYGWGGYNTTTHNIDANRIFIIKYTSGAVKKLTITLLSTAGKYVFNHANLDNSSTFTDTVTVANYSTKNFFYVSLTQHAIKDREPASASWDMLFTQYSASSELYMGVANQLVTGVLTNVGVQVAQVQRPDPADAATYSNYATATFVPKANIIGWDWKNFTTTTTPFTYYTNDSLVYFVKKANGDIWKLRMTKFGWSATGTYYFSKQKLFATAINDVKAQKVATVALAPNPAIGQSVNVVYSFEQNVAEAKIIVTDIAGRIVMSQQVSTATGLQQHIIPASILKAGMYIVNLVTEKGATQQKLIVQ